jgi:hypothetical protein
MHALPACRAFVLLRNEKGKQFAPDFSVVARRTEHMRGAAYIDVRKQAYAKGNDATAEKDKQFAPDFLSLTRRARNEERSVHERT